MLQSVIPRLPRLLAFGGGLAMAVGLGGTVVLLVLRHRCTDHPGSRYGQNISGAIDSCQGYTPGVHWSFLVLGLGAALIVAAAVSPTHVVQKHAQVE